MSGIVILILRVLLIICLYGFLGLVLYALWKNIQISSQVLQKPIIPKLKLKIEDPDLTNFGEFETPEVIIGRDPGCDFIIPRETVSAHHSRLSYHHKNWWIEDMISTNGTFLNEDHVQSAPVLVDGDTIRCGDVNLDVKIDFQK